MTGPHPVTGRDLHPSVSSLLRFFAHGHLPVRLQRIARRCEDVALVMAAELDGPELAAGLRKLLEAKDCFVRAAVDTEDAEI